MKIYQLLLILVFSLITLYTSFSLANELSQVQNKKQVFLPKNMQRILFLSSYDSVSLISIVFQLTATFPYLFLTALYIIYYILVNIGVSMPHYLTLKFEFKVFLHSTVYVAIVYMICEHFSRRRKHVEEIETEFYLFVPWKFISMCIALPTSIMVLIFMIVRVWTFAIYTAGFALILIIIIILWAKYSVKYSMNLEQLCGIHGEIISYKKIAKVTKLKKRLMFGIEEQTRVRVVDTNGNCYTDFVPREPEAFISTLMKKCPNAIYIVEDNI